MNGMIEIEINSHLDIIQKRLIYRIIAFHSGCSSHQMETASSEYKILQDVTRGE